MFAQPLISAANTDINTIFGSVINENLTDEVIVTVIATGFDKTAREKSAHPAATVVRKQVPEQAPTPQPERVTPKEEPDLLDDDDDDENGAYELPPFLRNRNY